MPKKVLIVEDSALQAKMYKTVFSVYQGCELVFAVNGLDGLDKLSIESGIDLIILDINMPKMNGIGFLEAIKKENYSHIPIIVISTEGKDDDIRRAIGLGAKAYVKKPWTQNVIRDIVDKVSAAA